MPSFRFYFFLYRYIRIPYEGDSHSEQRSSEQGEENKGKIRGDSMFDVTEYSCSDRVEDHQTHR